MSLLHPALLSGLGLAVIPILLHLLLRAKPKRLIFPALRLIQQNRRQNVRRLQLRHLWLLILRVAVILLIVFALTRPSLPAANYSFVWYEWLLLFAVLSIGAAAYFGTLFRWNKKSWPRNLFLTRRTMLRGGVGAATAALLLLCVGWPYARRVSAEIKAPAPKVAENIPVAAIFLFDTSPRMSYRQSNQTRLQAAQQIARDHLGRFPGGSKVAVAAAYEESSPAFSLDLQAAKSRVDALDIRMLGLPLNERLRTALLAQEDDRRRVTSEQSGPEEKRQDRYLREIYIFTDLTRSSWREDTSTLLRDELQRLSNISIYLIDVGETAPSNVGITSVKPMRETVTSGGNLIVDVAMSRTGNIKSEQTVELFITEADGKMIKKAQQQVTLENDLERTARFEVLNITGRYQQGEVHLVGSDPLTADDVGYFTVQTLPLLKIGIVAENLNEAKYWKKMLDDIAETHITDYATRLIEADLLSNTDLSGFDVVCLVNVSTPDIKTWTRLNDFVSAGGGLCVFLGAKSSAADSQNQTVQINPVNYNSAAAGTVMPVQLLASLTHSSDLPAQTIDFRKSQNTFLKRLDDFAALTELGAIDVRQYWKVEPIEDGITVARYTNEAQSPALIERRIGQGRVMVMTTSVTANDWNDFVGDSWFFVFADQLMLYLSQQATTACNFSIGGEVSLPLDRERKLKKIVLRMPDFKQRTQEIPADSRSILLKDLNTIGGYQVDSANGEVPYHSGFSMNLAPRQTDLKRLEPKELDNLLGEGRYSVNRDPGSLERNVQTGRLGQEVYSMIVTFLVIAFALEQFTATWFYRTDEA